jgi:hypothetical protein
LERLKLQGQPAQLYFMTQKLDQMAGDLPSLEVWWENCGGGVELLSYNDRNDLGWINWNIRQPYAALGCDYRDRFTERPPGRDVYVVDALESQRLRQVNLDD